MFVFQVIVMRMDFFSFKNLATVVRLSHSTSAEGLNVKIAITVGHTRPVFDSLTGRPFGVSLWDAMFASRC